MNTSVVVDASIWVSWLRPSDTNHGASRIWMEQYIANNGQMVVPTLLLIEVAASISRQTGKAEQAQEAINRMYAINTITIVPMNKILVQVAVEMAIKLQLRAGDATYVAVAYKLKTPLLSWDKEQLQRAASLIPTYTPGSYVF